MDLARLQELKQKLLHDEQLGPVYHFFFDHLGQDLEFLDLGERIRHPLVEEVLKTVGEQLFGKAGKPERLILTNIADHYFIHGGFIMCGQIGGVIYFEDERMGLAAISDFKPPNEAKFARFSCRPGRRSTEPSMN